MKKSELWPNITDATINKHIGSWLRQSNEREESRRKKNDVNSKTDAKETGGEAGTSGSEEDTNKS